MQALNQSMRMNWPPETERTTRQSRNQSEAGIILLSSVSPHFDATATNVFKLRKPLRNFHQNLSPAITSVFIYILYDVTR